MNKIEFEIGEGAVLALPADVVAARLIESLRAPDSRRGRPKIVVAAANVPHLFGKESWYWTSTPYSNSSAWAVDFEHGAVCSYDRNDEFRVRPFRSFKATARTS